MTLLKPKIDSCETPCCSITNRIFFVRKTNTGKLTEKLFRNNIQIKGIGQFYALSHLDYRPEGIILEAWNSRV